MVERASNGVVPEVNVPGSGFHVLMGFLNGGHDHRLEVFRRQDYYLVIVVLSLVMIRAPREEVRLFVSHTGFMVEGEMVLC